jgi:hypothetical protein
MSNVFGSTVPANTTGSTTGPKGIHTRFSISANGTLTAVRYYTMAGMAATDIYFGIFSPGGTTMLADWYQTPDLAVGWHTYNLPTPIALVTGVEYDLLIGKESGTINYSYALGALPITANNITFLASLVRVGASFVWAEWVSANEFDNYYVDLEMTFASALDISVGVDQAIYTGQTADLVGTAVGGSGGKTYAWTKTSGPSGTFGSPLAAASTFTPSGAGTYVLRCTVTDGSGTDFDELTVTVSTVPTKVPLATINSAVDWTVFGGGTVQEVLADTSSSTGVQSVDNPTNVVIDGVFGAVTEPPVDSSFTVEVEAQRLEGTSGTFVARLYEGATLRSTQTISVPSALTVLQIVFPPEDIAVIASGSWTSGLRFTLTGTAAP